MSVVVRKSQLHTRTLVQGLSHTGAGHSLLPAVDPPIRLSCRSAAVNGDCLAPCALSCSKPFPARAADRHDGAPSGRAPSPWLCTGSRRLCARKCGVPPRRRGGDVQGASGRIDSWLNTARRRRGFVPLLPQNAGFLGFASRCSSPGATGDHLGQGNGRISARAV